MTKEEAKERFGDNIINKLLSLGAEPTNVCRNDDIVEWCSDGCIKVGGCGEAGQALSPAPSFFPWQQ